MKEYCLIILNERFLDDRLPLGYLHCAKDQGYIGRIFDDGFHPLCRQEYIEDFNKSLSEKGFPKLPNKVIDMLKMKIGYLDIDSEIELLKERGISGEKLEYEIEVLKLESENWCSDVEATVVEIERKDKFKEISEKFSKRYNLEIIFFDSEV